MCCDDRRGAGAALAAALEGKPPEAVLRMSTERFPRLRFATDSCVLSTCRARATEKCNPIPEEASSMTDQVKETKAQRVERLKRELNPWECLEEVRRFARDGYDSIPPEWLGTYFRWWGVYTQGDGAGVLGGKGGEGKAAPYFMLRI